MKKVLVISYYWPPAGGPGVQRMLKFVKYMPDFGVEPIVLTIHENNAFFPVTDSSLLKDIRPGQKIVKTKNFEILRLFSKMLRKKEVPFSGFANHDKTTLSSKVMRFLRGNLLIPDARRTWVKSAYREACRLIEAENITNIIISSPPHSSQLIGLKLKKKYPHIHWIADMRDPWTDIYYYKDLLHTSWARKLDLKYEREVIKQADSAVVVSHGVKEFFMAKYPHYENKMHVIWNGFDEEDFDIPSNPPQNEFVITYTGTIADSYNPEIYFSVLSRLIEKYRTRCSIKMLFVGKTSRGVKSYAEKYNISSQVQFIDYVPHEQVIRYLRNSTVLFLLIAESTNQKGLLSGKLFEYLAAKKPIIGLGPTGGDAEDILESCSAGKIFGRSQEEEMMGFLSEKVEEWLKNSNLDLPGTKINVYSRRNLTGELCKIINN